VLCGEIYPSRSVDINVRIIENNENFGFAKGNNIGIEAAKRELIATLNNELDDVK